MDALDIRIVRAMGIQPNGRSSKPLDTLRPASVAKRLGVTQERVRDRIAKMEASGVIGGYDLYPNYRHLGLSATWYYYAFDDEDTVDRAMAKLEPAEGIGACCAFVGGIMCVNLTYRSPAELQRRLRLLVGLAGAGELRKFADVEYPPVHRPLSRLDWRIVMALRGNAMRSTAPVAEDLNVSAKTVKRRLERMAAEGSVFVFPWLNPPEAEGVLLFYLVFQFDSEAGPDVLGVLSRAFDAHLVATETLAAPELGTHALLLAAKSMGEVESLRRKGTAIGGVKRAKPLLFRAVSEDEGWMNEAIEERMRALPR